MAHVTQQLLALLQNVEIDERHLQIVVVSTFLYAVDVPFAYHGEFVLALVGLCKHLTVVLEAACRNHRFRLFHQVVDGGAYRFELVDVDFRQRVEVVINVLLIGSSIRFRQ